MKKLLVSALLLPVIALSDAIDNCFTFLKAGDSFVQYIQVFLTWSRHPKIGVSFLRIESSAFA